MTIKSEWKANGHNNSKISSMLRCLEHKILLFWEVQSRFNSISELLLLLKSLTKQQRTIQYSGSHAWVPPKIKDSQTPRTTNSWSLSKEQAWASSMRRKMCAKVGKHLYSILNSVRYTRKSLCCLFLWGFYMLNRRVLKLLSKVRHKAECKQDQKHRKESQLI